MPKTIYIGRLLRLTLTRRGKAVAKHPLLRENAVEAVKAMPSQIETTPLWETTKATPEDYGENDSAPGMARLSASTAIAIARYVLPVPAGPMPNVTVFLRIAST